MKVTIEINKSAVSILTADDLQENVMPTIKRCILGAGFTEAEYEKMVKLENNKIK